MSNDRSPGEWSLAVRQQAAVAHLGRFGLQSNELEEVLREGIVVTADTLGLGEVALFELMPDGRNLRGRAGMHDGRIVSRRGMHKLKLPAGRASLPGFVMEGTDPVASSDIVADERFHAMAPERGVAVRSAIASPIAWDDRPWGAFVVYDGSLRKWTSDEVQFVQAIASTMGLTIQRSRIERALRDSSTRLDLSLRAGGLGAWSWDFDDDCLTLNASAAEMYGLPITPATRSREDFLAVVHPEDRSRFREPASGPDDTPNETHSVFRIVRPDNGELRWIESWGRRIHKGTRDLHLVGVCSDVTERRRAEEMQVALLTREHAARVEAETARERLSFLSEASALLGSSLDPDETLQSLGDLCVPTLGDICFIDVVDEEGVLRTKAELGSSEAKLHDAKLLRKRREELGAQAPTRNGHDEALAGEGVIYHTINDEQLVAAAADPDHLALFRRLGARSTIMAPLVARGRVIGVLTLIRTGDQPLFLPDDLVFVEELAARAAMAADNGRLFHSRNRVARSLQAALLPPALPAIPGLALAARYDVAEADVAIGGDFYDVIPVATGSWGVVVGDVCGRGPDAAALTGLVRHTLRTAVVREQVPSHVLTQTNEAMLQQIDDARFCTAAYLRVDIDDPASGRVRVSASSAGHPRPVLVRADGRAEVLDCAGTLLGVVSEPLLVDTTVDLGPGDAVVLYTDGVTEARRGNELFGEGRLVQALSELAGGTAEEIAGGLDQALAEFRRSARDDTAILVVQAQPSA